MALIRFLIALLIAVPSYAQPVRIYECAPFLKGGRGSFFVEPIVHVGSYGLHYAWACKDPSTDAVRTYVYFCRLDACNPTQLVRSFWLITTSQSTLVKEWAKYTTIKTPVAPESPDYLLALEAQGVLDQLKDRVTAKENE